MKFVVASLALVCLANAAPQNQLEAKAQQIGKVALKKGVNQLQQLINKYGIKGANGQNLNVLQQLNKAQAAAEQEWNSPQVQQAVQEAKAQSGQVDQELKNLQAKFQNKNLIQVINTVKAQAAAQIANIPNNDIKAAAQSALNAANQEAKQAFYNSGLGQKSLNQLKNQGQQKLQQVAHQKQLPTNQQQAMQKANQ